MRSVTDSETSGSWRDKDSLSRMDGCTMLSSGKAMFSGDGSFATQTACIYFCDFSGIEKALLVFGIIFEHTEQSSEEISL